jgi:uncharacterized phiE125 gp8 family phage protein
VRLPSYTVTVQPTAEPISVADLNAHARVDGTDELLLVQGYISAAREFIEGQTGRAFMTQTLTKTSSRFVDPRDDCYGRISFLERTPLASVVSVKYYDENDVQQTLATTVYDVVTSAAPGFIYLKSGQSWPTLYDRPDAVEVTFTAGASSASAVPPTLRHAIALLASHLYEHRQPVNVGNIINELPYNLRSFIESNRVGGWCA